MISMKIPPPGRIRWLLFCAGLFVVVFALCFVMTRVLSQEEQRRLAGLTTVWGLNACLMVLAASLSLVAGRAWRLLGRQRCLTALGLVALGYLACYLAPRTNRIYFDEHIYMQVGQNIAHTGRAECSDYAKVEYGAYETMGGWVNKQPNGHPYVLSWAFRFFGTSPTVGHVVNRLHTGLAAAALFLALSLVPWPLPRGTPLTAAVLFCLTPLVPWWGHTVAVEPGTASSAALAFLGACLLARLYHDNSDKPGGEAAASALLAALCAFACYFRPESLLVYPVALVLIHGSAPRALRDPDLWAGVLLSLVLLLPNVLHLWSMRTEDWGATDGRRFSMDFLRANLESNGGYFLTGTWFPLAGTLMAVTGLLWLFRRHAGAGRALLLWFLMSWGIFILFYAGGYHYGASSRYGVVSCAPVAALMGIGACALWAKTSAIRPLPWLLAGLALINWSLTMHYVPGASKESAEARGDVDWVERLAPTLPEDCLVVSNVSCVWNVSGINAVQFFVIEGQLRNDLAELHGQYPGGIYLHWDYWLSVTPPMAAERRKFLEEMHAEVIHSFSAQDHHFALLRLDTPYALEHFGGRKPDRPERPDPRKFKPATPPAPAPEPAPAP